MREKKEKKEEGRSESLYGLAIYMVSALKAGFLL